MDRAARIPVESREEFDRWFRDDRSMERPGDGQSQRPTALQAVAPADLSPGHSIDSDDGVDGHAPIKAAGRSAELAKSALWASPRGVEPVSGVEAPRAGIKPGSSGSIDFDWVTPPPPTIANVAWYRHRAEDCGDLAAEMVTEGLDGPAYGAAIRAANYGRIALDLYEQRRRGDWAVPGHAGNFL